MPLSPNAAEVSNPRPESAVLRNGCGVDGIRAGRGQDKTAVATDDNTTTMTNDNNTRTKANAVFFSVIMVLSMVAIGFAAAPAAADASNVNTTSTPDVTIDQSTTVTQNVTYNVTADSNTIDENVTIDTSNLPANIVQGATTSLNDGGGNSPSIGTTTVDADGNITVGLSSIGSGNEISISTVITHDTTDVSPSVATTGVTYQFEAFNGTQIGTSGNFDIVYDNDNIERLAGDDVAPNGSTVYQGEEDVNYIDNDGSSVSTGSLQKTTGDNQGTALQDPIASDAATGTYAENGQLTDNFRVVVQEPRITTAEVQYNGGDVDQVATSNAGPANLSINASWNFGEAENLELTVEDESGADVTDEVIPSGQDAILEADSNGDASVGLGLADEDTGDYTVIFESEGDIGTSEEYTITTTSQDSLGVSVAEDEVPQGDNVDYTIDGGADGQVVTAVIEDGDFGDSVSLGSNAAQIFRNVDDVESTGADTSSGGTDYAYANLTIDGTQAVGSINTQYLDDSSITVDVYDNSTPTGLTLSDSSDDDDFDVSEGTLSLDGPSGTYTIGEDATVNGTASTADQVRLYALNNDNWEVVEVGGNLNISVDSDDTFEEEDVTLSSGSGGGNNILGFPGRYNIGVISVPDALAAEGSSAGTITTSNWTSATSTRSSIQVAEGDLSGNFETFNGQIATEDGSIDVNGVAAGQQSNGVVAAFVDERGNVESYTLSVDDDGTYDEDDLSLGNLSQGQASGHIISVGRDDQAGDGSLSGVSGSGPGDLQAFIQGLDDQQLTGNQVRDRIVAQTTEADATDDLMVSSTFRFTEGSVSIDSVYPEQAQASGINPVATGETMVVAGSTNRKADDNSIVVDVLDENGNSIDSASTDEWAADGQWMVTVDTSGLETGTYTVEADTGDSTDRTEVELVEERDTGEDEGETDDGETDDGETDDGETDDGETDDGSGDDGASDDGSGDDGSMDDGEADDGEADDGSGDGEGDDGASDDTPGFGAVVALVALLAAALLATRRRD